MEIYAASNRVRSKSIALVILCCVFFAAAAPAQDKLVFAVDIIRHGDRTPLTNHFKEDPTNWPEGFGRLTALGSNQEYALGSEMRRLYYGGLLDSNTASQSICAFSTDTVRTRQSAGLFLSGLVGDPAATIPIHLTIPIDIAAGFATDNVVPLAKAINPDATNLEALESRYIFETPEWKAANAALEPQFARWGQALGVKIKTIGDLEGLGDALYIHQIHHVPWTNRLGADDIAAIIAAGRWAFVYQFNLNMGGVVGKPLLRKIAGYVENARREEISGKRGGLKYVLFSAHDDTLLSEMSALKAPLTGTNSPPYAALLHFGLFEAGPGNFHIRVNYKDHADHVVPDPETGRADWTVEDLLKVAGQ
jgi:acid phosphatase